MVYRIKELRIKKMLSQDELAKKSGISRATIAHLESNKQQEVKLGTLKALASALQVQISDLYT